MANDILIIGAGATGLMAARLLSKKGNKVSILEARNRVGGRIYAAFDPRFGSNIELGAEFIHGDLPETLHLLKQARLEKQKIGGEMWQVKDGKLEQDEQIIDHMKTFESRLKDLKDDMTIDQFLGLYFPEEKYAALRESVRRYASGYDTADPAKGSAIAFREEWLTEDDDKQYRVKGGYTRVIDYLKQQCLDNDCILHTETEVSTIIWEEGAVTVQTANGKTFTGNKVLITLPVAVIQAGKINFSPALPETMDAFNKLGMGAVIKTLFLFNGQFWENKEIMRQSGRKLQDVGFIFSKEQIPTWWTQCPEKTPMLTGWLGGPEAAKFKDATNAQIEEMAINSLAHIFKVFPAFIKDHLLASKIINWTADPYTLGSYSYATIATAEAREILAQPIANTIYFAGEALYDGPEMGTVEAALSNARKMAETMVL